jgi:hypothetical protein
VNGNELLRRLTRLGRALSVEVWIEEERGKGSHATIHFGRRFTILKIVARKFDPVFYMRCCANSDLPSAT